MGKSLRNWISLNDTPDDMYGKVMSIPDDNLTHYAELCCGWSARELDEDLPEFPITAGEGTANIPEILLAAGLLASKSEARRLLADGGIRLDRHKLPADPGPLTCKELVGKVLQRGRLHAVRLVAKE
jgi:tyrosyl-tRNA synthetase